MKAALTAIQIKDARLYHGARYGLSQPTASITIAFRGNTSDLTNLDSGLAAILGRIDPHGQRPQLEWQDAVRHERRGPLALAARLSDLIVTLLRWSREPVFVERSVAAKPGELHLALPWSSSKAFRAAMNMAIRILGHAIGLQTAEKPAQFAQAFSAFLTAMQLEGLSPAALQLADAAHARGHPVERRHGFAQIGWGAKALRHRGTMTDQAGSIASRTARNKHLTIRMLADAALPVPANAHVATFSQALEAAQKIGWPVVVKPSNLDGGIAVTTNIRDEALLREAFDRASVHAPKSIVVEQHVAGEDHRLLVVKGQMLIASKRTPGGVTGDGRQTVIGLLDNLNADPTRGVEKRSMLLRIEPDQEARECLAKQGLTLDSVPPEGVFVRLRHSANIGSGGTSEDVTARVHPDNRSLAIQATRALGLDIAGVDFLVSDIARSWREIGGAICEVNAQPGLRVHWLGDPLRDLSGEIVDLLTDGLSTRIPVAVVFGEGCTDVARRLHAIRTSDGRIGGLAYPGAGWVAGDRIGTDDLAPHAAVRAVLQDLMVETATFGLPTETLRQIGHLCDRYDLAALTDANSDHARLAREVAARTTKALVLGADNPAWTSLQAATTARIVLVGEDLAAVAVHCAAGGEAVYGERRDAGDWIMFASGERAMPIAPLSADGRIDLFAAALACAERIPVEAIRSGLASA